MSASEQKKIVQYDVLAQRRGDDDIIRLWLSTARGARGKKKLIGEAQTVNSEQPHIYFKVGEGGDAETVFRNFLKLLVHRGYLPKQSRHRTSLTGRWTDWSAIPLEHVDEQSLEKVKEHEKVGR